MNAEEAVEYLQQNNGIRGYGMRRKIHKVTAPDGKVEYLECINDSTFCPNCGPGESFRQMINLPSGREPLR